MCLPLFSVLTSLQWHICTLQRGSEYSASRKRKHPKMKCQGRTATHNCWALDREPAQSSQQALNKNLSALELGSRHQGVLGVGWGGCRDETIVSPSAGRIMKLESPPDEKHTGIQQHLCLQERSGRQPWSHSTGWASATAFWTRFLSMRGGVLPGPTGKSAQHPPLVICWPFSEPCTDWCQKRLPD